MFHIVLSVPICIIAVNGAPVSESEKSIHQSQNYSTRLRGMTAYSVLRHTLDRLVGNAPA